nr:MAG TPA: hypothetical protein [Caudoviricetes sp.]
MSQIKATEIEGDVAIGRHVTTGGNATIQGNATVNRNLRVKGWLDAPNIKGANKGLFESVVSLREAYPHPHDGWFAGVPASDKDISDLGLTADKGKTLFRMYIGIGGDWVCEPLDKLYEITVDSEQIDSLGESLADLLDEHVALEGRVDAHDTGIADLREQQTSHSTEIASLRKQQTSHGAEIAAVKTELGNHSDILDTHAGQIDDIQISVRELSGATTSAQDSASAAMSAAEAAAPRSLDISQLDTMGTDGGIMAMRGLVVDAAHTRYCVTATSGQRARTVGYLDIMTDSGQHVLTQVLTTHYTFTPEGVLDSTSHTDSRIRTYFRSYGLSSGTVGDGSVPSLAWTSWREMVPETVAPVEVESEERLNAMLEAGELEDGRMYFVAEEE